MALTLWRWIAIATIACLVMSLSVVHITEKAVFQGPARSHTLDTVESRLSGVASARGQETDFLVSRYRIMQLLDSVQRVSTSQPDTGAVRMFIDRAFSDSTRALVQSTIAAAIRAKPFGELKTGVDVFFVLDTASLVRGVKRFPAWVAETRYMLPKVQGERCNVYVRMPRAGRGGERQLHMPATIDELLGPCAYYGAFGEPGPHVREWLMSGGWRFAVDGSWTVTPPPARLEVENTYFKGPSMPLGRFGPTTDGMRCIVGELRACEIATRQFGSLRPWARAVGDATSGLQLGAFRYLPTGLGDRGGELLADAVRGLGRERFQAFWASPDSVPRAFEAAAGESWGKWLNRWTIDKYGTVERGPRVTSYALSASVILVLGAVGAALWFSAQRRYA